MWIDLRMVAPSLVTVMLFLAMGSPTLCRILSMPLGPKVVLTKSAMAIAPTNDCYRGHREMRAYHSRIFSFVVLSILAEDVGQNVLGGG